MSGPADMVHAYQDDPTAVVVDVLFAPDTPDDVIAAFRRDALALRAHWSAFGSGALTPHGRQCTFTLGESKRGPDLDALRDWLAAQGHVRQVVIEIWPNWRPAAE